MSDIYCQLIPNDEDEHKNPYYEMVPRLGALEISFNGILLFSKMLSKVWPNATAVANKCRRVDDAYNQGQDLHQF
jgi:hypothetical protein